MIRKIFVCLFLIPFTIGATIDHESKVTYYEKMVHVVSKAQASTVSKEIRDVWIELQDENKECVQLQKKLKQQNKGLDKRASKLQKEIILAQQRNTISVTGFRTYLRFRKAEQDISCMKQKHQKIMLQMKRNRLRIRKIKKQREKYDSWISRLNRCQAQLARRFQNEFQDMKEEGTPHWEQTIPGDHDLPAYGFVTSEKQTTNYACPLDETLYVDGYSQGWIPFIQNGTISAGTWSYPHGGLHLGLDVAAPLYSPIQAGANGLVLYADACVPTNCGYLGNYCGWPYGGGNTICMLMAVNDQLYAVSLNHLSNQIYVVAGQQVHQGDIIAKSGNSGNSTGPHTHIELFQLNISVQEAVQRFRQGADFAWGCGWDQPATCSDIACRIRPETVF
ncbi:MAG: peptidoglycan DD-metalloendopeptidase family protein [Absicoccus sp.]|uniref:M23 family metallopeptidase n=1 Tax=Absicoccus sp. TaxID=2718527 RepID=UPI002A74CFD4|nr:peptidoglycan DD-metalloendopeptidase family protein [Absicoccus sp.]MDY3035893.1 peptidoglycan DD-metalloendopeptidase family protein [Absicoccus sp.]